MPKSKQFLGGEKKKSKHATPLPATADEYLAAGVDFEEAGEKWRAGDAAKSTRFFIRAIDCYDEALKKFPSSFDLAYNKARVQYELTQHPSLLKSMPGSLKDLLQTALDSSRYALGLVQDNADVLFNTAQVLTSLAEHVVEPLPMLQEALELFHRCLTLQELQYAESQAVAEAASAMEPIEVDLEDGGVLLSQPLSARNSAPSAASQEDDRWASIIEPVTNETLLDTVLAQLETLTTLGTLLLSDSGAGLSFIEEYSSPLLTQKLPIYLNGVSADRLTETGITRANFISASADANFRTQRINAATYFNAIETAFAAIDLSTSAEGLVAAAESLVVFNSALRTHADSANTAFPDARWKALSKSQEALTSASKLPDLDSLAKIHLLRGDVDILRFQLGQGKYTVDIASKSATILVKNAEKYYRGAKGLASAAGETKITEEATVKEALAKTFGDVADGGAFKLMLQGEGRRTVTEVLQDALEDGLVDERQLRSFGL